MVELSWKNGMTIFLRFYNAADASLINDHVLKGPDWPLELTSCQINQLDEGQHPRFALP